MANENPQSGEGGAEGGGEGAVATTYGLDAFKEAGIPDTYVKDGSVDLKSIAATITEAQTFKTQAEERAKAVPADGKYDFALPKEFKIDGVDLKSWNVPTEMVAPVAAMAKEMGLTQADVSKLVAAYATGDAAKKIAAAKVESDAQTAQLKELGENGPTRLTNLEKAINAAGYGALLDDKSTLKQRLEAFEKIINSGSKMAPKGGGPNGAERPDADALDSSQMFHLHRQEKAART